MSREMTKEEKKRLRETLNKLDKGLENLQKELSEYVERIIEAKKNSCPRDPISDAW